GLQRAEDRGDRARHRPAERARAAVPRAPLEPRVRTGRLSLRCAAPRALGSEALMIPSLDLILGTIERALTVAILPAAGNASAKEEASIGILFTGWLRDVVDHVADAERASYHDCRAALGDVAAIVPSRTVAEEIRAFLAEPQAETT